MYNNTYWGGTMDFDKIFNFIYVINLFFLSYSMYLNYKHCDDKEENKKEKSDNPVR